MSNSNTSGNIIDRKLFVRVLKLASPFKLQFFGATALALIIALLSPARPYLIQLTVDNHIFKGDVEGLIFMVSLLVLVLIAEASLRYNFIYLTNLLGQSVIKNLRVRVFKHILRFRLRYFDTTPVGTSTTRAINDVETINDIFSQGLITIIADLLTLIMIIFIMLYTDWKLALVSLTPFPFIVYATYIFKEKIKGTFQVVRTQVARMNAFLQEHITGMSVIQIFGAEEKEMETFKRIHEAHKRAHIRSIWYYSIFFPVMEIIMACALGLLVWFGSNLVIDHQTTLGILIAFIMYINMLFRPLRMLADKFNTLQMGMVASDRVFGLLDRTAERIENTGSFKAANISGNITFDKVWFAYNETDFVLKGVSFELNAGQTLAIVGHTGAGKSSVINLLYRLYDYQKGGIYIDGRELREYELYSLRSNMGMVLQDVFLFSGSIYDNITLRNPNITKAQVVQAARIAGAHEFIERLPGKYDYNVMERGATLSLGQRQLISFIRALVFDPRIIILDEATSSIDTETEQLVQNAMEKLLNNRTNIIIAHRLSTIQNADVILALDKGTVAEMGTHEELLNANGIYKELYDTQLAGKESEIG